MAQSTPSVRHRPGVWGHCAGVGGDAATQRETHTDRQVRQDGRMDGWLWACGWVLPVDNRQWSSKHRAPPAWAVSRVHRLS